MSNLKRLLAIKKRNKEGNNGPSFEKKELSMVLQVYRLPAQTLYGQRG